jgi:hypothetical protein
VITPGISNYC